MGRRLHKSVLLIAATLLATSTAQAAEDVVKTQRISMELANAIATQAVEACREKGYQVTATVVDRGGTPQVVKRDVYAPAVSVRIARQKAYTAAMFSVSTGEMVEGRSEAAAQLNHVDEVLVLRGGLPVTVQQKVVGGVGVSGAPDSQIDEDCAQAGLDHVSERLQFGGF